MPRICFLLPGHWGATKGGAEYQAHHLAEYLARSTPHEVVYLTKRPPPSAQCYEVRQFAGSRTQRFGMTWDFPALYDALRSLQPDLIIQRVACAYTGIAAIYAARRGARLLWHVSSDRDVSANPQLPIGRMFRKVDQTLFRYGVRHAAAIVCQTEAQATLLETTYGRPADAVIPNFATTPAQVSDKPDPFTVVWIGNIKRLKRPELFLRLARDLAHTGANFKMIGRPDPSPWGDAILREAATLHNLDYLGEVEHEAVESNLDRAHLLVNTSEYEGMPNTLIQAWLRRVPTITLGIDPDGLIERNRIGLCATNYTELARGVVAYLEDRARLDSDGARARDVATVRFSMNNLGRLASYVEELLARASKPLHTNARHVAKRATRTR